ncbi:MAG: hypothetical protein HY368_02930 [Candidatus Aenigmarchaeota archaeon]|nr:hypothetical protein [Candidatus Aenigmarchaeota archaeon]
MRKHAILLLLASVVVVSACVQNQVKTDENNGLVINSFVSEPATATPTDSVSFFLDGENVGDFTSECARAQLFNVDSWRLTDGRPVSEELEAVPFGGVRFIITPVRIQVDVNRLFRATGLISVGGGDVDSVKQQFKSVLCGPDLGVFTDSLVKTDVDLLPPDVNRNRAGKIFTAAWTLFPPVLPEGVSTTFKPTARIYYLYKSNAVANIPVLSINEFRRRQNTGQAVTLAADVSNQRAPVKIALTRGQTPVVVDTNPKLLENFNTQKEKATFVFELQNVGKGFVTPAEFVDGKQGGFIFGKITLLGTGAQFSDCLGAKDTKEVFISGNNALLLKMRSDKKVPFACTISIDRNVWQQIPEGTMTVRFEMFYVYNVDAETSVKVLGVESGQTVEEVERGLP